MWEKTILNKILVLLSTNNKRKGINQTDSKHEVMIEIYHEPDWVKSQNAQKKWLRVFFEHSIFVGIQQESMHTTLLLWISSYNYNDNYELIFLHHE